MALKLILSQFKNEDKSKVEQCWECWDENEKEGLAPPLSLHVSTGCFLQWRSLCVWRRCRKKEREKERERESVCVYLFTVWMCVCVSVCECVLECVCVSVWVCIFVALWMCVWPKGDGKRKRVSMCVCVREKEREKVCVCVCVCDCSKKWRRYKSEAAIGVYALIKSHCNVKMSQSDLLGFKAFEQKSFFFNFFRLCEEKCVHLPAKLFFRICSIKKRLYIKLFN